MKGTTKRTKSVLPGIVLLLGLSALCVRASESAAPQADVQKKPVLVRDAYPGPASNSLTYAKLSDLPSGVLRKAEGVTLTDKDGKEVFRHVGYWPQAEIEKKLDEMGVTQ